MLSITSLKAAKAYDNLRYPYPKSFPSGKGLTVASLKLYILYFLNNAYAVYNFFEGCKSI